MRDGRILFVSQDAGGTVPPMLALAQGCVSRGHDVTVLGHTSIGERTKAAGSRFVPFTTVPDYETDKAIEDQLQLAMQLFAGSGPGDDLLATAEEHRSDVVVIDCNLAGAAAAAEKLGRPSVILLHAMYKTRVDTWFADYWPLLAEMINATRSSYELDEVSSWTDLFSRHARMYSVVPKILDAPVADLPPTMRHFGFLVPEIVADGRRPSFPDGSGESVLISLSTTYQHQERLLQTIVDALADLDVRALVTTGGHGADLSVPPNVVVRDFVPHQIILGEADAVVTHGGLATVAAALSHGVPLVCTPIGRDQLLNADRVATLGAGVTVGVTPVPEDVRRALIAVLKNADYRRGAQAIARASAEGGGVPTAVQDLETLLFGS